MPRQTSRPERPAPVQLRCLDDGTADSPAVWRTLDGRFVITRREPTREIPHVTFVVVDTARANILGNAHDNRVVVFELADARAMIDRVLYREWGGAVQRWLDAQRRAAGRGTLAEEVADLRRRQRLDGRVRA